VSADDREDRPRPSWREIDQRRGGSRQQHDEPKGRAGKLAQAKQTSEVLKQADSLFSLEQGGVLGARLAKAMRDAHGSEGLAEACREYCREIGTPRDPGLLALLLDSGDPELVTTGLEALLAAKQAGSLELGAGLKSQLRVLQHDRDDTVAGISEELLEE
jgi:hypothetical protein